MQLSPGEDLATAAGAGDASVNKTTTKTTAATVTADAILRSRSHIPSDGPRLEGIRERYTPNHLKQYPPLFFRRDKTDH
jgi:hypothetical protein